MLYALRYFDWLDLNSKTLTEIIAHHKKTSKFSKEWEIIFSHKNKSQLRFYKDILFYIGAIVDELSFWTNMTVWNELTLDG